jgi:hypothetical protein
MPVADLFDTTFAIERNKRILHEHFSKFDWDWYFSGDDASVPFSKDKKHGPLDTVGPPVPQHQPGTATDAIAQTDRSSFWSSVKSTGSRWWHSTFASPSRFASLPSDPIEDGDNSQDELCTTADDRSSLRVEASGSGDNLGGGEGHLNKRHIVLSMAWNRAITEAADLVSGMILKNREEQAKGILDLEQQKAWRNLVAQLNEELGREAKRLV